MIILVWPPHLLRALAVVLRLRLPLAARVAARATALTAAAALVAEVERPARGS